MVIRLSQKEIIAVLKPYIEKKYGTKITGSKGWYTPEASDAHSIYGMVSLEFVCDNTPPPVPVSDQAAPRQLDDTL